MVGAPVVCRNLQGVEVSWPGHGDSNPDVK